jgi:RNA recognition motif-containing protein
VEVRLIPTKRDIAFVEYADEASATVAKDALHNFKIDGETKMKVRPLIAVSWRGSSADLPIVSSRRIAGHVRKEVSEVVCVFANGFTRRTTEDMLFGGFCRLYISHFSCMIMITSIEFSIGGEGSGRIKYAFRYNVMAEVGCLVLLYRPVFERYL